MLAAALVAFLAVAALVSGGGEVDPLGLDSGSENASPLTIEGLPEISPNTSTSQNNTPPESAAPTPGPAATVTAVSGAVADPGPAVSGSTGPAASPGDGSGNPLGNDRLTGDGTSRGTDNPRGNSERERSPVGYDGPGPGSGLVPTDPIGNRAPPIDWDADGTPPIPSDEPPVEPIAPPEDPDLPEGPPGVDPSEPIDPVDPTPPTEPPPDNPPPVDPPPVDPPSDPTMPAPPVDPPPTDPTTDPTYPESSTGAPEPSTQADDSARDQAPPDETPEQSNPAGLAVGRAS